MTTAPMATKPKQKKRLIINGSEEEVRHLGFVSASVCERLPSSDGTPNCVGTYSFAQKKKCTGWVWIKRASNGTRWRGDDLSQCSSVQQARQCVRRELFERSIPWSCSWKHGHFIWSFADSMLFADMISRTALLLLWPVTISWRVLVNQGSQLA